MGGPKQATWSNGMHKIPLYLMALMLFGLAVSGCVTKGMGEGSTLGGAVHALFTWKATGPARGEMTAVLNTGQTYAGPFFQITQESRIDTLGPLWIGWHRRWRGWEIWEPNTEFVTHYSGRVLANLAGPDGTHMRCDFQLMRPTSGMAGGGVGRCQLPDGTTIDADFPPS